MARTTKTKKTKAKKGNGKANFAEEFKGRFEKITDDFGEFHDTQRKKMEEFIENYSSRLQKLRDEVETKTSEGFSQIASHLKFATRDDVDEVLKKLANIDRKLNKISREVRQ